jgi:hypothetical protein
LTAGINLKDNQIWVHAVGAAGKIYEQQPYDVRSGLNAVIDEIMQLKAELLALTQAEGGADICSACGGVCCNNGKFHLSLLDALACFYTSMELPAPDFEKSPLCPYGHSDGCTMAPEFRPATCVIFNCEQIDDLINGDGRERLHECERLLREKIQQAEQLLGFRVGRPLLLSFGAN